MEPRVSAVQLEPCGDCAYFVPNDAADPVAGHCHRHPPNIFISSTQSPYNPANPVAQLNSLWPPVDAAGSHSGCGDHS